MKELGSVFSDDDDEDCDHPICVFDDKDDNCDHPMCFSDDDDDDCAHPMCQRLNLVLPLSLKIISAVNNGFQHKRHHHHPYHFLSHFKHSFKCDGRH